VDKHGNRGLTKKSGSADVLETLGIRIDLTPEQTRHSLDRIGAAFFFAPHYHPSFAHIAPVRKFLGAEGRRTIFNSLGPILNPARPDAQIIGVFDQAHLALYDGALSALGRKRHVIIWGRDVAQDRAIGEASVTGPNQFQGSVSLDSAAITPVAGDLRELNVSSAEESAARIVAILDGTDTGLGRSLLVANAAVALATQGGASSLAEAIALVDEVIDSGNALKRLRLWQEFRP
jgi:anthranilate phosphoribosyltransferase